VLVGADPHLRLPDNAECVHSARVATRQLRTDLRLFSAALDPTWVADVRVRLKQLAALLGAVRDADVLTRRIRTLATRLPVADESALDAILQKLGQLRAAANDSLRLQLSEVWYVSLLDTLAAVVRNETGHRLAVPDIRLRRREVVAQTMRPCWKKLKRAVRRAGPGSDAAELHRIRIRAKSCRYAAEAITTFIPRDRRKPYKRFVRCLARLQERLGRLHDGVLGQATLRTMAGVDKSLIERIIVLEAASAVKDQTAWRANWEKLSCGKLRFW